jgi:UDP-glucose 4-epimerase
LKYLVTGCAGFIGSNVVDRLISTGHEVVGIDNFSTGQLQFIKECLKSPLFHFFQGDLLDCDFLNKTFRGCDFVIHLAANADVRFGTNHPDRDIKQNTLATFNVLEAMRLNNINKIAFSSTGSVYGDTQVIPTPESAPFPIQTSLYAASKLAGEGLITAYSEGFNFQSWIFRFVSILGERYSHGHVFDFYKKLLADPSQLNVLGDGHQKKSYLYIQDCLDAMFLAFKESNEKVNIFNLGVNGFCEINDSIGWITDTLCVKPKLIYSGGKRGWVGDNPYIHLDVSKIHSLGWSPKISISDGVIRTVNYLKNNLWLLDVRD